jgi:imidazolonepropionase-like amidohydrolase
MADLVLKGGHVIDPASGRDEPADIAFSDGKITEIGRDLPASGADIVDVHGLLVVPGLIDLTLMSTGAEPPSVSKRSRWRDGAGRRPSSTPAVPAPALSPDSAAM